MTKLAILLGLFLSSQVFAQLASDGNDDATILKHMLKDCKTELAQYPPLLNATDIEVVWKNIEVKEHGNGKVKLSDKCYKAHAVYEKKKFHTGE